MTREEAIKLLEHISTAYIPTDAYGDYDDPRPYEEAIDMAIESLSAETEWIPVSERLPNVGTDCTDFIHWISKVATDEELWDLNAVGYGEIICRKLVKIGALATTEKPPYYYVPSADRPSGEWKYLHGSIGSYMTMSCPFCGETFNDVAEWKYNFCPNCGARMTPYKGGDNDDEIPLAKTQRQRNDSVNTKGGDTE